MKKTYIQPSIDMEIVDDVTIIATSGPVKIAAGEGAGTHDAESKTINFADDNESLWGE